MFKIDRNLVKISVGAAAGEPRRPDPAEAEKQLREAAEAAEEILKGARAEAGRILKAAEGEAAENREKAAEEGWRRGYEDGAAEAEALAAAQRERDGAVVRGTLLEIERERDGFFSSIEGEIVELCLSAVRKITGAAIDDDGAVYESMIKKALLQMKCKGKVSVSVPEKEFVRLFSTGTAEFFEDENRVFATVRSDPDLSEHGLVIEAEGERVDAGADTQLRYLRLAFDREYGKK